MIRFGSDFSGVGAANQALIRLGVDYKEVFACDMDKFARQTFIHNYGEPKDFPENVYDRVIPDEPLDLFVGSPPCQAFSLAGERGGENDERGILFYNTHEFIKVNKPKFFVIENVKGLLSIDGGRVFNRWTTLLGGKSVNRATSMFPDRDSVPYHVFWSVMNAKDYNVPQSRERVFIVGVRDDSMDFKFPMPTGLKKRLKDILEPSVDERYFLSERMLKWVNSHSEKNEQKGNGFRFEPLSVNSEFSQTVTSRCGSGTITDPYIEQDGRIRRLTPRECFRLMDFPDSFDFSVVSDTQAYKQAGNSVVVKMYELIFKNLFEKSLQV